MTLGGRLLDSARRQQPAPRPDTARAVAAVRADRAAAPPHGMPASLASPADGLSSLLARAVAARSVAAAAVATTPADRHAVPTIARKGKAKAKSKSPPVVLPASDPATEDVAQPQPYAHPAQNPALLESIYPHRERALRKFVTLFREIELHDYTADADRAAVVKRIVGEMDAELERLTAVAAKSKSTSKEVSELEKDRKKYEQAGAKAWDDAIEWEAEHRADPLAGKQLQAEVDRLIGTGAVPAWVAPMVRDYAGMRYQSGHSSYLSPVRLLFHIEASRGSWDKARTAEAEQRKADYARDQAAWEAKPKKDRGKAPREPGAQGWSAAESAAVHLSPASAATRLEQMYQAREIPRWAWHKIVRLTELRTRYATEGWESTAQEEPGSGPIDATWAQIMSEWQRDSGIPGADFNPGHGSTAWRTELNRRNALITTRIVCNELSEAALRHRGITLTGGISKDVLDFQKAEAAGTSGAYFKQLKSAEDLRPGATLFFLNRGEWKTLNKEGEEPDHAMVRAADGGKYPLPAHPGYEKEKKAWDKAAAPQKRKIDAWDKRNEKGKAVGPRPAPYAVAPPVYDGGPTLPEHGKTVDGWLYTVIIGQPITRTKDGETQWLGWKHQAQVIRVWPDGRVFTLETTVENAQVDGKSKEIEYSGFRVHKLKEMIEHGAFVGFLPGTDTVTPQPAAAAAAAP